MTEILINIFIYLAAAVVAVPISKQLGLGSVLGYLIAGVVIGPGFHFVGSETQNIQHVAEFGVVMMLFLVGLELEPKMLWALRHRLLGLGGLQVVLTALAIALGAVGLGVAWQTAIAIGLIISMSSTAIVLQTLSEKGLIKTPAGQSSFSVLLFQDIAFIPMLALIPLLALPTLGGYGLSEAGPESSNLLTGMSGLMKTAVTLGAIGLVVIVGHYLLNPLFRYIVKTGLREIFTAFALLLVVGIAVLMTLIGLSPALGTFVAGVVLANSEYRHQLESTIEPFKGLLLGLFFITVGAGINMTLLASSFFFIFGITLAIIFIKFLILFVLGRIFKLRGMYQWLFALSLSQAGEFGFVLISFSVQTHVIPRAIADQLLLVVALSMMLTPLLFILFDKVIVPRQAEPEREADTVDEQSSIIIAGHGRFGQIINRLVLNCGYRTTVLDLDAENIEGFARFGLKTFFGDASRPELLDAAKIAEAKVLVIAIDNKDKALEITRYAKQRNPELVIIARAQDRNHVYDLYQAGAKHIIRETFDSSLRAAKQTLIAAKLPEHKAERVTKFFFERDRQVIKELADLYDPELPRFANKKMFDAFKKVNEETIRIIHDLLGEDMAHEIDDLMTDDEENQLDAEITEATAANTHVIDDENIS